MSLDLQRVRALCFDVDGTLSDTDDQYVSRVAHWLRWVPFLQAPERSARRLVMWAESPGTFLMGLADRLGLDDEIIGVLSSLSRSRNPPSRALPAPIPGVATMLADLRRRYPMAVISARDERSTLDFLDHAGLRPHFQVIVTALSTPHTKPHPDPVLHAARQMGVPAASCLMIGDTTVDIQAGRSAGAQTVGVLCGFGERPELLKHGADLILDVTSDLQAVLAPPAPSTS